MSKRKWKVYTTDELRDRFQMKPGMMGMDEQQKMVAPNMKRRNSAPPGMIHFPPGTFTHQVNGNGNGNGNNHANGHHSNHNSSHSPHINSPSSSRQQHELITHAARSSPTLKSSPSPYGRNDRRRASLPYIPPMYTAVPAIESYLSHLQNDDSDHASSSSSNYHPSHSPQEDRVVPDAAKQSLSPPPGNALPSFQSLLQTIREDMDEEDTEIKEIEERAMMAHNKVKDNHKSSPQPSSYQSPHYYPSQQQFQQLQQLQQHVQQQQQQQQQQQVPEQHSPSSKFYYKNKISSSAENLPSLSKMSISDIVE